MHPADSAAKFQDSVNASGMTVEGLDAAKALARMLAFYHDVRAENCIQDEEGDTLLFQWSTYDQGQGPNFQLELTRQFIEPGDEDEDGMSQLSLTLQYASTDGLLTLGKGGHQCGSPAGLAVFEAAVLASQAYRAVTPLKPQKVSLLWCLV
ncbi:hypothetical protein [Prosthecobacter sp.]|uniref:hypothetical protein n=1 Tax=Prosthecobacter sp. TaxID=1965333 RepID=UPI002AB92063|nr:hypothetical protein [Prosthecobacter sp.]MDZ4401500.1 hypothetical protein [Prosthecobacter sp.]